nr:MAG TPA: hypothetical protein [Caudoviricetes sp.]
MTAKDPTKDSEIREKKTREMQAEKRFINIDFSSINL